MHSSLRTSLWAAVALLGVSVTQGHAALPVNKSKATVRPATKTTASRPVVATTTSVVKTTNTAQNHAHHHHGSALANVLHELHHAQQLLHVHTHVAQHHRTKAEAEIAQAIHHLQQHPHHQGSKTSTAVKKPTTAKKAAPQGAADQASLSTVDSKFRQAQKMVHAALHQLHQMQTKGSSEHHHHFGKAIHELKQASHQIQEAMRAVHTLEKQMAAANNS